MVANKTKVCKECGFLNDISSKVCEVCKSNQFLDKYKGTVVVLDNETSEIGQKVDAKSNGCYALKYG